MNHKDLEVWKVSMDLVIDVYNVTDKFPNQEMYGLTNQIRRCAISIPSNIAEGSGRETDKDNNRFITIALGSVSELETQLLIAERLGYLKQENEIFKNLLRVQKLISGFKRHITKKIKEA